ncbi:YbaK/prolyl-tRNA synthetase associated domain-containing protein [Streptomyces cocklensis]|jgi:Ala-tRNA(Pro) deacylase|uniref:Ala-tRNA(Pro) deacylase n=1 Tax=Actinacidiphila cocklensis TaxID=887465 RepID=A0A9W4DXB6_9ACTN|nr:YbaK/EbsC family protein [Actinacidiphila cocklensis]MDD1061354.1 YbaK/prolyl-tRNA synthetase associated domain-containing protein [Actinacidiphila cocklensis]WSX76807.1 YbaK/prolyl-tRNA synthetase associated domain-containing protein [Streptomyces sp. NBC_00899]CAG6395612.1 Ala-tRNA(Pro) deacylase [Actinacidiphila cocklensis]
MASEDVYGKLISLLDEHGASYRIIEHEPEGVTEAVSRLRGHDPRQAAKCIVIMVKIGKKEKRYAAAVLPGDRRVDFNRMKTLCNGTYASFATPEVAEELAGTPVGTIPPFSFDERMGLFMDPELLEFPEVFFNAGRLDRTIALSTKDYLAIANPTIEPITQA